MSALLELKAGDRVADYSWSQFWREQPDLLVDTNTKGVNRYLSYDPSKNLDGIGPANVLFRRTGEIEYLGSIGVGILPNWEANILGPLGGYATGARHGAECDRQMKIAGFPAGTYVPVSVDFDIQPNQYSTGLDYLRGFQDNCSFPITTYGKVDWINVCHDHGIIPWGWQTQAWSYRVVSVHAGILQFARRPVIPDTDDNVVLKDGVEFWFPNGIENPKPIQGVAVPGFAGYARNQANPDQIVKFVLSIDGHTYWTDTPGEAGPVFSMYPGGAGTIPVADLAGLPRYDPDREISLTRSPGGAVGGNISGSFSGKLTT